MSPFVPVIGEVIGAIGKVADDLVTSDQERAEMELKAYEAETTRMGLQTEINKEEAKNANFFVSGARPFVMWVCAYALAYAALLEPFMRFASKVGFGYAGDFPVIDTDLTIQVLFGILGLGVMRSAEKFKGVASK